MAGSDLLPSPKVTDAPSTSTLGGRLSRIRADALCLVLGILSILWLPVSLWPGSGFPAWPAVSTGLAALGLGLMPGRRLPRSLGIGLGLCGAVGGGLQIAALWALVEALDP